MPNSNRMDVAAELYRKAVQSSQNGSYLTEVAMPGCKPDRVNPHDVDHMKDAHEDDWV